LFFQYLKHFYEKQYFFIKEYFDEIIEQYEGNRRLIIMELSNEFQISFGSVQTIMTTDLDMRRVAAKCVPKLLCITIMHPTNSGHVEQQFLVKHDILVVFQPLYLPNLAPCDFFFIPKDATKK
jgi:hypothetical protein